MSLEQKTQSLRRQSVELLKKIDDRSGDFGRSNYLGMSELLREPFMADVGLSREDIQNAFLARRLDYMMRLPMDSSDEKALNQIVEVVERWKEEKSYIDASPPIVEERTKAFKVGEISDQVIRSFESFGLTGITKRRSDGYLTWAGLFGSTISEFEIIFDIRTKYMGSMRFTIYLSDRSIIYSMSNWETFCDLIYAVLGIHHKPSFIYVDNRDSELSNLKNYLEFLGLVIKDMKGWSA